MCYWRTNKIQLAKNVIKKLAHIANFAPNGSHGALSIFSWEGPWDLDHTFPFPGVIIDFSEQASLDSFEQAVDNVTGCFDKTDIIYGLNMSFTHVFQLKNGMREDTEKVAILITDGYDNPKMGNTIDDYNDMKQKYSEQGIKIIIITVGKSNEDNEKKLLRLVHPEDLFREEKFDDFTGKLLEKIGEKICKGTYFDGLEITC